MTITCILFICIIYWPCDITGLSVSLLAPMEVISVNSELSTKPTVVAQKLLIYPPNMCPLEKKKIEHLNLQEVNIVYQNNSVDDNTLVAV